MVVDGVAIDDDGTTDAIEVVVAVLSLLPLTDEGPIVGLVTPLDAAISPSDCSDEEGGAIDDDLWIS